MLNVSLAKPTDIFFIIERIYPRDNLVPSSLSIGELGPSLAQIHRVVIRLMIQQDMYMDGTKLNPTNISLWQTVKYILGSKVSTKETSHFLYNMSYAGSLISITLSPDTDIVAIPGKLTAPKVKRLPQTLNLGRDPIPQAVLYGKSNVKFFMDNGGLDTPTAMAQYNGATKELTLINDKIKLAEIMKQFLKSGIKL